MMSSPKLLSTSSPAVLAVLFLAAPAGAQTSNAEPEYADDEIVVIAERPRGAVVTEIPPVVELSEADIASYGASSVQDLIEGLSSQTGSGRGRGSGRPVVLINGQRTSGFREIRDLPPEAIRTVQVFPEELALQYGYRPDQRVINFILKDNYTGLSASAEYGMPTQGGQGRSELESTLPGSARRAGSISTSNGRTRPRLPKTNGTSSRIRPEHWSISAISARSSRRQTMSSSTPITAAASTMACRCR